MLIQVVKCDGCGKENDRFLRREQPGWVLDNGEPQRGQHACSKECAIKLSEKQAREAPDAR